MLVAAYEKQNEDSDTLIDTIEDTITVLDDAILWDEKATGTDDYVLHSKGFEEKHAVSLLETSLRKSFIQMGFRMMMQAQHY